MLKYLYLFCCVPVTPDREPAVDQKLMFYKQLRVSPNASDHEIARAYRKLAVKTHPDKNLNDPTADQRFQNLHAAYELLKNPAKRRVYDAMLEEEKECTCSDCFAVKN